MSLVPNERIKLTATAMNNLALAFAVAGFVAPLVSFSYGLPGAPVAGAATMAISLVWLSIAVLLHLAARWFLRDLKS